MTMPRLPRREFVRLAGLGGLLLPSRLVQAQPSTVDARTQFGPVRGLRVGSVNVFKSIPYGADTGAANRFRPPQGLGGRHLGVVELQRVHTEAVESALLVYVTVC